MISLLFRPVATMTVVAVFGAVTLLDARSASQTRPPAPPNVPAMMAAQEFVFAAYPDLMGRETRWTTSVSGERTILAVTDGTDPLRTIGVRTVPILEAVLDMSSAGELRAFSAAGTLVHQAENAALAETLRAQAGWTNADLQAYLTQAGAKHGASRALDTATQLDRTRWAKYLGAESTVRTASFQWKRGDAAGAVVTPGWVVDVDTKTSSGAAVVYRFVYEPFGGRLVAVTRQ